MEDKWSSDEAVPSQQLLQQHLDQATQQGAPATAPQVVEKIVYKQQRVHGFFRTLTLITLLLVGVLMLLEELKIFSLNL